MRRAIIVLWVTVGSFATACGGEAASDTTTTSPPAPTTTTLAPTTTTLAATTTTTPVVTTTSTPATTPTSLAGTPIDFGPGAGDQLMVIGVRHDDVLNLRTGPGADQPISDEIPPTFLDLEALGNTRELPSSFWVEVDFEGTTGWVHMRYIGYEGETNDDTARLISDLGETPSAGSVTALGELIASQYASEEPESDIVQVTAVTTGDLNEVIYDVVGLGDDAVHGVRIHIFAEEAGGEFTLRTVEITTLCSRGVDHGLCV